MKCVYAAAHFGSDNYFSRSKLVQARHLLVRLLGASDASSRGYGGTFTVMGSDYRVGEGSGRLLWLRTSLIFARYDSRFR